MPIFITSYDGIPRHANRVHRGCICSLNPANFIRNSRHFNLLCSYEPFESLQIRRRPLLGNALVVTGLRNLRTSFCLRETLFRCIER